MGGQPSDQKEIKKLSKKFKFKILEDASHSIGSRHFGEQVGSCRWSDITVFSFHPVKIITTGEGGMALTNNKNLNKKMIIYKENGIVRDRSDLKASKRKNPWYYEHRSIGFNYRMNDLSATLGLSQLSRLKKFLKKRNQIAAIYKKNLSNLPVTFQKILKYNYSSYHLFIVRFNLKKAKFTYKQIFNKFRQKGFFVNLHYMPIHLSPFFKSKGFKQGDFPVSENYAETSLSIPIYFDLKKKDVLKVTNLIKNFFHD